MQSAEASEHLADVGLKVPYGGYTHEEDDYIPKLYPPEGNHSPRVRHGGKAKVSALAEWKVAGNRFPNMQTIV